MQIVIVAGPGQGDQQVGFADPHSDMGLLEEGLVVLLQVLAVQEDNCCCCWVLEHLVGQPVVQVVATRSRHGRSHE